MRSLLIGCLMIGMACFADERADPRAAFEPVRRELGKTWPKNKRITIVCHGHSVPAGYFKTPVVDSPNAYPHLFFLALKEKYPFAVINVMVTAIGGENAESGAARFERDVLSLNPDVVTIDYALNDRNIGLERARVAWLDMIGKAKARGIPVILLTPTGDSTAKPDDPKDPLAQHAEQIRALAREQNVALADSAAAFKKYVDEGGRLDDLLSQHNHPNRVGHERVVPGILTWFLPVND